MKVFISWSKDRSREIATIFSTWLPRVIQECSDPFISTETVKGDPWFATITSELENSKLGVVFITPENLDEPWLNFEAGALLTKFGKQRVCPVLVGLKKSEYSGPLKNLQLTELEDRDDAYALVRAINAACERPLRDDILATAFDSQWETLAEGLASSRTPDPAATKPTRTLDDKIDEVLETMRVIARGQSMAFPTGASPDRGAVAEVSLALAMEHDRQMHEYANKLAQGRIPSAEDEAVLRGKRWVEKRFRQDKFDELQAEAEEDEALQAHEEEIRTRMENGDI